MANTTSAQKEMRKAVKRREKNLARRTSFKTAIKKVLVALERKEDTNKVRELLREAQAQLARAKNKKVLHANTSSRKIGRLAARVAAAERA